MSVDRRALDGRRVVVTRAAGQAGTLADLLAVHGATPVVVPLVETLVVDDAVSALTALDPATFDWLVVTSPNGAEQYRRCHPDRTPSSVAVIGTATAVALGSPVHLLPARQSASGLLAAFPVGEGRVLVVQAGGATSELVEGLATLGWTVTTVAPYLTVPARPTAKQQLTALAADAVLFAAGSAAKAWVQVFGESTPPVVVAMGPQTAAAAAAAGLKVTVVAADHSLEGLVDALAGYFSPSDLG
jgi:uroporphyrinogen-III synthase